MKNILYLISIFMLIFTLTSCNSLKPAISYNLTTTGDGDGDVKVEFPVGHYYMDGTASLNLLVTNDTVKHEVLTKNEVLKNNKKKQVNAMARVNDFMLNKFTATTAGGTYDFQIDGIVKESVTGISFEVHKRLTNRSNVTTTNDPYMFIK